MLQYDMYLTLHITPVVYHKQKKYARYYRGTQMTTNISLKQFTGEFGTYKRYEVGFHNPLHPIFLEMSFTNGLVTKSHYPCVVLKGDESELHINHIKSIKKSVDKNFTNYIIDCYDTTKSPQATVKTVKVTCT